MQHRSNINSRDGHSSTHDTREDRSQKRIHAASIKGTPSPLAAPPTHKITDLSRSSRSQCHVMIKLDKSESEAVLGQPENKGGREDWREKLLLQDAEQQQSALVVEQSHGEEQCEFSPCARYS